jgi:hypothetical protein
VLGVALQLTVKQRARLAAELLASLEGEADPAAESAWARELEVRARRALAGESNGTDWATVRARIKKPARR